MNPVPCEHGRHDDDFATNSGNVAAITQKNIPKVIPELPCSFTKTWKHFFKGHRAISMCQQHPTFWSETSLGWFGGEWNGNVTLAITLTQGSLPQSNSTKALEKPEYWHTPFSIPFVCKQGAINTI